jgi:hypothetical protein
MRAPGACLRWKVITTAASPAWKLIDSIIAAKRSLCQAITNAAGLPVGVAALTVTRLLEVFPVGGFAVFVYTLHILQAPVG